MQRTTYYTGLAMLTRHVLISETQHAGFRLRAYLPPIRITPAAMSF